MTVEWFDLGARLYAATHGRPVQRLAYATFWPAAALAVRATTRGVATEVVAADPTGTEHQATDRDALALLAGLGATIAIDVPPMLLTDDPATLPALMTLARRNARAQGPVGEAAALIGWWTERADHPGTGAVIHLPTASRARFVLGAAPAAEQQAATWRAWLNLSDTCAAMHAWAATVGGPHLLPLLAAIHDDDHHTFARARDEHAAGMDWTRPDSLARAALGLQSRCDTADLWDAALLDDPLWRARAVHTGRVTTGEAVSVLGAATRVACDRIDSRLRTGTAVRGWVGGPVDTATARFAGQLNATSVTGTGDLVLELTVPPKTAGRPQIGDRVCVMGAAPDPAMMRRSRAKLWSLYEKRSWLAAGHSPAPVRRDVPLDVVIAAADDDTSEPEILGTP
jgi:hypothetical protein